MVIPSSLQQYKSQESGIKKMPTGAGDDAMSASLSRFGGVLTDVGSEVGRKLRENREATQYAAAQTQAYQKFNEFRLKLNEDPEYLKYPEKYEEFQQQIFTEIGDGISEPNAKAQFQIWGNSEKVRQWKEVNDLSQKKEITDMIGVYENDIDQAIIRGDHAFIISRTNSAIAGGLLLESQGQKVINDATHQIEINTALTQAMTLPLEDGENYVNNAKNTPNLTPQERQQIVNKLRDEDAYQRNKDEREHQLVMEQANTNMVKAWDNLVNGRQGYLTRDMIDKQFDPKRDTEKIEHWYGMLNDFWMGKAGGRKEDDPEALANAVEIVSDWEMDKDTKRSKLDALWDGGRGGLLPTTYMNYVEKVQSDKDLPNYSTKNGFELINTAYANRIEQAIKDGKSEDIARLNKEKAIVQLQVSSAYDQHPEWTPTQKDDFVHEILMPVKKGWSETWSAYVGNMNDAYAKGEHLGTLQSQYFQKEALPGAATEYENNKQARMNNFIAIREQNAYLDIGGKYGINPYSTPNPYTKPLHEKAKKDLEVWKETEKNWKVTDDFVYPNGFPGLERTNQKTKQKEYWAFNGSSWEVAGRNYKSEEDSFMKDIGSFDGTSTGAKGEKYYHKAGDPVDKWYMKKGDKWVKL